MRKVNAGVRAMNVMDRTFSMRADIEAATRQAARRRRRIKLILAGLVAVLAFAAFYYWWTHLCGSCGIGLVHQQPNRAA
jgi:fatty acid desaturase